MAIVLGGIALFILGLNFVSENLQKIMGNRMRDAMKRMSQSRVKGILVGILLTIMIQSSGAVTSLLVGIGAAGVITLGQVMSVILGVTIGTTFTVQLLSFNVTEFGLVVFTVSFFVYFLSSNKQLKTFMSAVMGFGLMFWGLDLISGGTADLKDNEMVISAMAMLENHPFFTIIAVSFFTAIVHSSVATIGIAMTLASSGVISLENSIYWVYGANIGTTATALIASAGGNYIGKQVAFAHAFVKLFGVAIFFFATPYFVKLIAPMDIDRAVANVHTIFNILVVAIFLPFQNWGQKLIEKLIHPTESDREFGTKFLDRSLFSSSAVGMAHVEREILRMGDIVLSMVESSLELFKNEDEELEARIKVRDNQVDLLNREVQSYMSKLNETFDSVSQKRIIKIMMFASDLESVADVVDHSLMVLARKKHGLKLEFSNEGWGELERVYTEVCRVVHMSISCFQTQSYHLSEQVIEAKKQVRKMIKRYKKSHMQRYLDGNPNTLKTTSIHLDTLDEFHRIIDLSVNHVYSVRKAASMGADS